MHQRYGATCNDWFSKLIKFMEGIGVLPSKIDGVTGIWLYDEGTVMHRIRCICHSTFGEGMSTELAWYHTKFAAPLPTPQQSKDWGV